MVSPSFTLIKGPGTCSLNVQYSYFIPGLISTTFLPECKLTSTSAGPLRVIGGGTCGAYVKTAFSRNLGSFKGCFVSAETIVVIPIKITPNHKLLLIIPLFSDQVVV